MEIVTQQTLDKQTLERAIAANGGREYRKEACSCDPDVGMQPCPYCAVREGLLLTKKLEAERDAWIRSMQAAERKSDVRGEVLGQFYMGCNNRQDYAGAAVIAKALNYPNNNKVSGDSEYQTRLEKLEAERDKYKKAIEAAIAAIDEDAVKGRGEWQKGMFCGLEDVGITDTYEAGKYGYAKAIESVQEWIIDELIEVQQALEEK